MAGYSNPNFDGHLEGINYYVPAAQFDSRLSHNGVYRISFGVPVTLAPTGILSAQAVTAAATVYATSMTLAETAAPFGQTLSFDCSGADTDTVTVTGYDYLGQKMIKTLALTGTTALDMPVAFKRLYSIAFTAESGITVDVGWGASLGLPFKTTAVLTEEADGVGVAADSPGTLTLPVLTDPATAATGDVRGLYTPVTAFNSVKDIMITAQASRWVNTSGNGGIFGIRQYGG